MAKPSQPIQDLQPAAASPATKRDRCQRNRRGTAQQPHWDKACAVVGQVARHYANLCSTPLEDLRQEAWLGLLKALPRFDADRGVPFVVYARQCCRGAVLHYLRDKGHLIRIPRRLQERSRLAGQPLPRKPCSLIQPDWLDAAEPLSLAWAGSAGSSLERLERLDQYQLLRRQLQRLRKSERTLLESIYIRNQSARSIARQRCVSPMKVHRELHGILSQLRSALS